MNKFKGRIWLVAALVIASRFVFAQSNVTEADPQYNPNSIEPIPKYEQFFKMKVWRRIDLKEKQNKGFFSRNGEITKVIIEAVKSGELADKIYTSDSLVNRKTKEEFLDDLVLQEAGQFDPWEQDLEYYEGDQVEYNGKIYTSLIDGNISLIPSDYPDEWQVDDGAGDALLYLASQVSLLMLCEDVIFDKRRSRLYHDIQSIQLIVPGSQTPNGIDKYLGVFRYKDLHKLFLDHPDEAIWFNRYNTAENKNFTDAFRLRLFHGSLFKVENPDDLAIEDIYTKGRMEAVMASEWLEMQMMEKEHNLWEY
ncbi:MAG: gliding motility protein GldN [Bacteroidota bacterium]